MLEDAVLIPEGLDDNQACLLAVLEAKSPFLGEIYRGMLHAFHSPPYPNQSRVLAYQARELMEHSSRLMSPYGATLPAKPPTFNLLKKQLDAEYRNLKSKLEADSLSSHSGQLGCNAFLEFVEEWLQKAEQARPSYKKLVRSHVSDLEPSSLPPVARTLEMAVRRWIDLKETFNTVLHASRQVDFVDVRARVSELEDFLLNRVRPRPFEDQAKLDALLAQPPDAMDEPKIQSLLRLIETLGVNYRHFFNHLDSPEWIGFLEERGFFSHPPELDLINDQIHAPDWPELLYLKRCAAAAPDDVGRIAREVSSLHPDNPRVHETLVRISTLLLQEDSNHGRKLLNSELDWISCQEQLQLEIPIILIEAAVAAAATVPGLALRVARSVLSLEVSEEVQEQRTKEDWHRLSSWDPREILQQLIENLLPVLPSGSQIQLL
ncbi:hypothetical protein KAR02_07625, partial [Candidatus Bipolaricaulota bacterium]|nr:hypothetical protein [Candidatus Bipolaricaulota bacterium]